ncbi:hypothetical protein PIB30_065762 [Stylosanthes scabra]|uniref:Uncharacterized protein n=1 Tax=Stylosanthes scabra TaxID=79078 RepID=A0ABU6YME9_9FABA|nr:hypothetical protein [Stylosanthes scabra]
MGSGFVFYEYEYKSHKEYDDVDVEATLELRTIKIRRYHFKDKKFTYSVHSGRFDLDFPYEFPIAMLGGGGTFGAFRPMPSAATTPPHVPHAEPTLTFGPFTLTYLPCQCHNTHISVNSSPTFSFIPPSKGFVQRLVPKALTRHLGIPLVASAYRVATCPEFGYLLLPRVNSKPPQLLEQHEA